MKILAPQPEDMEQISQLYATTWLDTYPNETFGISYEDILERTKQMVAPERIEHFKKNVIDSKDNPQHFFNIAKEGEKIVGVCAGQEKADAVHMASLYVLPEYQGKGIGSQLFAAFKAWANPEKDMTLHVVTYNKPAIAFYTSQGFVDTGKRFTEERYRMESGNAFPEMEMVRKSD